MNNQKHSIPFMGDDFLLETNSAKLLFHKYAAPMPVIDYHCHLDPQLIAEDHQFADLTELWLQGDHYKWRIMRANGVAEEHITGTGATNREKFQYWVEALNKAYGNPLYHWTHLELQRYFDYHNPLTTETAQEVWDLCNKKLAQTDMTARHLIKKSHVKVLATTDDPIDSLEYHKALEEDPTWDVKVLPSWRPDKVINIDSTEFVGYVEKLSAVSKTDITNMEQLQAALTQRMDIFHKQGCRVSDHGLDKAYGSITTPQQGNAILQKSLQGQPLTQDEIDKYKTYILSFMSEEYAKRNWTMQLHFAAARNTNTKQFQLLGPDTGFDSIGKSIDVNQIISFFDELEIKDALPKTILYSLNPNDEAVLASVLNSFQGVGLKNKIQLGVPWWFNDTKSNMEQGLITLANATLLGNFIGMLTDSRSFVSYPRHEYFRRILCNLLGNWMENGEIPPDIDAVGEMVKDICYNNANAYFAFE